MLAGIYNATNGSIPLAGVSLNWGATSIQAWSGPAACASCGGCPPCYNGWLPPGPTHPGNASVLHNAMLLPFQGPAAAARFPAAGAMWYQGEDNAMAAQADYYACALRALVEEWRTLLASPALWFGVVQLAPWVSTVALNEPVAALRQAQAQASIGAGAPAGVSLITAADGGDPSAPQVIHPRSKALPGGRLARAALAALYGRNDLAAQGPIYASAAAAPPGPAGRLSVTVSFQTAPPAPGHDFSSYCPTEVGVPADNCAWFAVQASDGLWRNASAALVAPPGGGPPAQLTLTIDTAPASGLTAVATSAGYGLWPVLSLRNVAGFPALPWNFNVM